MEARQKRVIALLSVAFLLMMVFAFADGLMSAEPVSEDGETPVGEQLWDQRTLDTVVLAVMLFAAVLGIIALVGGDFKWS